MITYDLYFLLNGAKGGVSLNDIHSIAEIIRRYDCVLTIDI